MTLPDEERKALRYTRDFLSDLMNRRITPGVSKDIRERAAACLRHYPWPGRIRELYGQAFGSDQ